MVVLVYVFPFIIAALSLLIAAVMLDTYHAYPGRMVGLSILASAVAMFAYGMELISPTFEQKYGWLVLRQVCVSFYVLLIAFWVLYYIGTPARQRRVLMVLLTVIPLIDFIIILFFPSTRLVYANIWLDTSGSLPTLDWAAAPLFWVVQIYLRATLVVVIYLVFRRRNNGSRLMWAQSYIITAGLSIPIFFSILYLLNVRPWGILNVNVFSYFPSALVIWYGAHRYQLVNLRPIGRTLLFEQMTDGMLVTDEQGVLVDINPAAQRYLLLHPRLIGQKLLASTPEQSALLEVMQAREPGGRRIDMNGLHIHVTTVALVTGNGQSSGDLTILHDVSDRLDADRLRMSEAHRHSALEERQKIARTLHDSVTQYLNSLVMLASTAQQQIAKNRVEQIPQTVENIITSARQAQQELRAMIHELQEEGHDDQGFDLLRSLAERVGHLGSESGLHVELETPKRLFLDGWRQREIFYIITEALNNIIKHSGAERVIIRLAHVDGVFTLEVLDNGRGFDPRLVRVGGMGLANIKARAGNLAGELTINSKQQGGTQLLLRLPTRRVGEQIEPE
jgi:signal transduction histidine kinase